MAKRSVIESMAIEAARAMDYVQDWALTAQAVDQLAGQIARDDRTGETPTGSVVPLSQAVDAWVAWGRSERSARLSAETVIIRSPHGVADRQICLRCAMRMHETGSWPTDSLGDAYAPIRYADAGLCSADDHGQVAR